MIVLPASTFSAVRERRSCSPTLTARRLRRESPRPLHSLQFHLSQTLVDGGGKIGYEKNDCGTFLLTARKRKKLHTTSVYLAVSMKYYCVIIC